MKDLFLFLIWIFGLFISFKIGRAVEIRRERKRLKKSKEDYFHKRGFKTLEEEINSPYDK
jgi:hypothetical protein